MPLTAPAPLTFILPFAGLLTGAHGEHRGTLPPLASEGDAVSAAMAWLLLPTSADGSEAVIVHNGEGRILAELRREAGRVERTIITSQRV